jgi:PAS domain S-box-containing protein
MSAEVSNPLTLAADQLHAFYDAFFNHSGNAVAVLSSRDNGDTFFFMDVNPASSRFGIREPDELIGNSVLDCYPAVSQTALLTLIKLVWSDSKTRNFEPTFYKDERIQIWVKGFVCKLPDDKVMVVLEDVSDDVQRHQQQELELVILSELRNTNQLSQVIPKILHQIKEHLRIDNACLYLLPKFQSDISAPCTSCDWVYCDKILCTSTGFNDQCGTLFCPHQKVLAGEGDPALPFFTTDGSFWFKNLDLLKQTPEFSECCPDGPMPCEFIKSGCVVALRTGDEILGLLQVTSPKPYSLNQIQVEFLEVVGASIGMAIGHRYAEEQLRKNEGKLRLILNSMPTMLNALDSDGHIVFWNNECERVTGYSAEDAKNMPDLLKRLYPDENYRAKILQVITSNDNDFTDHEFELRTKDGSLRTISWSNVSTSAPIEGWNFWATGIDITRRKKIERVLQGVLAMTSRETGATFFRNLTKGLAQTLGVKCAFLSELLPNTANSCGTRAIWTGKGFRDNFVYELAGTPSANIADLHMCTVENNVIQQFPDDQLLAEMEVESYAGISLQNADGSLRGILAVMDNQPLHDKSLTKSMLRIFSARAAAELERQAAVEQQQRLETQLRQSQKMEAVGQLAGGIAHDFNNLLQVILGYTELVSSTMNPQDDAIEDLNEIRNAGERARDLVQQLLSYSSRQVLYPEILNVNQVVNRIYNMIQRILGEHIQPSFDPGNSIHPIQADKGQLDQIIINLCVNARDAMPNGGQLKIKTSAFIADRDYCSNHAGALPGIYTRISISDTGIGMPDNIKNHIFEPFFSTKGLGKGTGLGLSTVFGITAQHKGFIEVQSQPAQGTTFHINFPASEIETKQDEHNPDQSKIKKEGHGKTILFAEDEEVVQQLGVAVLEKGGYQVLVAKDGEEAIALYSEHAEIISMALLDVVMPRKSGPDVYRFIRQKNATLPVLFATGYSFNLLENEIPDNDCDIISKPFSPSLLLKKIKDSLDASAHLTANESV